MLNEMTFLHDSSHVAFHLTPGKTNSANMCYHAHCHHARYVRHKVQLYLNFLMPTN